MGCSFSLGSLNKYSLSIFISVLVRLLMSIIFNFGIKVYIHTDNISLIDQPIINTHLFIWFIYFYFGCLFFGTIFFIIFRLKQRSYIYFNNNQVNRGNNKNNNKNNKIIKIPQGFVKMKSFLFLIFVILLYLINEIIVTYFDQKNYSSLNFFELEVFIIFIIIYITKKQELYEHQTFSLIILFTISFGIKLTTSFSKQCIYPLPDINDDENFANSLKTVKNNPTVYENMRNILLKSIHVSNRRGLESCKNMFSLIFQDFYSLFLIIIVIIGYFLSLILHSYSIVQLKSFIDEKFYSPYLISIIIGIIGLLVNISGLIIAGSYKCGNNFQQICVNKEYSLTNDTTEVTYDFFFDKFNTYTLSLRSKLVLDKLS